MVGVGPVARNHSNLYNKLISLVPGCHVVLHAKVNVTGVVVGVGEGNRTMIISGWSRQEGTGETGEGRGGEEGGGLARAGESSRRGGRWRRKDHRLVGDVH